MFTLIEQAVVMLLFLFNATVIIITGITELAVRSGVDKLKCRNTRNYSSSWATSGCLQKESVGLD